MHDRRQDIVNLLRSPEFPTLALILKDQDDIDFEALRSPDSDAFELHRRLVIREELRNAIRSLAADAGHVKDPFDV